MSIDFVLNDKSEIFMYSNEEEYNAHFIRNMYEIEIK